MEITKEEITRMVQEAYAEGFNTAIECLKSAKDGIILGFLKCTILASLLCIILLQIKEES